MAAVAGPCWNARRDARIVAAMLARFVPIAAVVLAASSCFAGRAAGADRNAPPILVTVDATDAPRRILRSELRIPARPGELSLSFPKWNPGEHAPTGPINDVMGLTITAAGRPLAWRRDPVEAYRIRCLVPAGAREVVVRFALAEPPESDVMLSARSLTDQLAILEWPGSLVAPSGVPSDSLTYEATLRLPAGWKYATSLPIASAGGGTLRFAPVTYTRLIDSPVLAGRHMRSVPLTPPGDPRPMTLDLACDGEAGLALPDSLFLAAKRLVREADALFRCRHFDRYHFLLTMSEHVDPEGLEHSESSDDRVGERTLLEDDGRLDNADLLTHEYTHSWNGKYRRPVGLATPDYDTPMTGELLWVYEGLTQYIGWLLAARSGFRTAEQTRDDLAVDAAFLDAEPGRQWRPLIDTGVAAHTLTNSPRAWRAWRRGLDYYSEGEMIWLEADVTIRRLTHGTRSLDDFCRAFHGGGSGPPRIVPYTRADVVRALNDVAPYDWAKFFADRVDAIAPHPPLAGITAAGWKVAYGDSATETQSVYEREEERIDWYTSIGARFSLKTGDVLDVMPGSAADRAGLTPGMALVGVDGRKWSHDVLVDAAGADHRAHRPLELLVANGEYLHTLRVDVSAGLRYARLVRIAGTPDVLSEILAPHAAR